MKNGILISVLAACLVACGGDSGNETPTINTEFSAGIKGIEAQPTLTNADIAEGDRANLNTNYTGNILEDSSVRFSFTLPEDKQILLVLSSAAIDLDLSVSGSGHRSASSDEGSNELLIFDAQAGVTYYVRVQAWEGSGEFQLKLVEANRSSVGLANNEYLVQLESVNTMKCIEDGVEQEEFTDTEMTEGVINWSSGYIGDNLGNNRTSFGTVDGNTFTTSGNHSYSEDGYSGSSQGTLTLSTDFTTGEITGSSIGSYEYSGDGETGNCTYTSIETGRIVL